MNASETKKTKEPVCIACGSGHVEYGAYSVWPNAQAVGWFCMAKCGATRVKMSNR